MSRRTERLGVLFREEISALLQKGLKDPRVGFATKKNCAHQDLNLKPADYESAALTN